MSTTFSFGETFLFRCSVSMFDHFVESLTEINEQKNNMPVVITKFIEECQFVAAGGNFGDLDFLLIVNSIDEALIVLEFMQEAIGNMTILTSSGIENWGSFFDLYQKVVDKKYSKKFS